jgi:hypothetical protein
MFSPLPTHCRTPYDPDFNGGDRMGKAIRIHAHGGPEVLSTLFSHIAVRETSVEMAADLFAVVRGGHVKIPLHSSLKLGDAADAHRAHAARQTADATMPVP